MILKTLQVTHCLSPTVPDMKMKARGNESITHKLASAECWKVATNPDNLPSDLAPTTLQHFDE